MYGPPEVDPCSLYVLFPKVVTGDDAKKVLEVGKEANSINFGRMVRIYFESEDQVETAKQKISEVNFSGERPKVENAYKQHHGSQNEKRALNEVSEKSSKKQKVGVS
ncbi:hypothetical protein Hamer_G014530 [Homarus americanus]|uniref:Uncharacterized protein n=1 Tax=Homarus americanus TaxID=6706 RepID=A0A8J5N4Y0_HOMAM|nr:hypothetical protein Hamer_G014530 [Homarus americanus]